MTDPYRPDPAMLEFLLDGKKPKYRRQPRRDPSREWTEMESAAACEDEYQLLLYNQFRFRTVEDLRLEVFAWVTAGIGYDDAAAWLRQGAGWAERRLLFDLAGRGITPADTAEWWTYSERGVKITVMQALLGKQVTVSQVVRWVADDTRAEGATGE